MEWLATTQLLQDEWLDGQTADARRINQHRRRDSAASYVTTATFHTSAWRQQLRM